MTQFFFFFIWAEDSEVSVFIPHQVISSQAPQQTVDMKHLALIPFALDINPHTHAWIDCDACEGPTEWVNNTIS